MSDRSSRTRIPEETKHRGSIMRAVKWTLDRHTWDAGVELITAFSFAGTACQLYVAPKVLMQHIDWIPRRISWLGWWKYIALTGTGYVWVWE